MVYEDNGSGSWGKAVYLCEDNKLKSLAIILAKWFKSFPFFGRFRFWCLYWAYRITGWHIRHKEWDFVLDYLPPLGKWQSVSVLDVGCSRNLFCYEVKARGYELLGVDMEIPNFKYPCDFMQADIRECGSGPHDFVTCISVLEHIETGKDIALKNMINSLKIGGRLLLTIPTHEFAQGHPWHGFNITDVINILPTNAMIQECTERAGQLCFVIERVS